MPDPLVISIAANAPACPSIAFPSLAVRTAGLIVRMRLLTDDDIADLVAPGNEDEERRPLRFERTGRARELTELLPPLAPPPRPRSKAAAESISTFGLSPLARQAAAVARLANDEDDAAHAIAQADEGDPFSDYVHAMMHRREADFGNARYWARRLDGKLTARVGERLAEHRDAATGRATPMQLVDCWERAVGGDEAAAIASREAFYLELLGLLDALTENA